jgi:hypothetical protein
MSDAENPNPPKRSGRAAKPAPGSREERLAEALRANLRRRKAAARKPDNEPDNDSGAAQSGSEKSPDPS